MITIKNVSTATVVISSPEIGFRRDMVPGRTIRLEKKEYEDLSFDPGFQALIAGGFIKLDGLEEDKMPEEAKTVVIADVDKVKKMFEDKDYDGFTKLIRKASAATKDTITETAVAMGVTDAGFVDTIKKYCEGCDVIGAINFKHQAEEKA